MVTNIFIRTFNSLLAVFVFAYFNFFPNFKIAITLFLIFLILIILFLIFQKMVLQNAKKVSSIRIKRITNEYFSLILKTVFIELGLTIILFVLCFILKNDFLNCFLCVKICLNLLLMLFYIGTCFIFKCELKKKLQNI